LDLANRPQPFPNAANRMVFLFELYEKYTSGPVCEGKTFQENQSPCLIF
jgi:hypothetical protein